jgi:hypothetical protein
VIRRTVRAAALVAVAIAALVAAPTASAGQATMTSLTQQNGFITAEWTLPDSNTSSLGFEISDTAEFQFPVLVQVSDPSATSLTTPETYTPRTWYVRVITTTTPVECDPDPFAQACIKEISTNSMSVNVPQPSFSPPTNVMATQHGGRISLTWSLSTGTESIEIEIGSTTKLDDLNYFIDFVDYDGLFAAQESYTFLEPQPPGIYYVHVGSIPSDCQSCNTLWSDLVAVTIPSSSSAPPPPPPPPPPPGADKVLSLGAVTASASQKVDALSITLNPGEAISAKLSGTVSVPGGSKVYRFKPVSKSIGAGLKTKLSLKLPAKGKKAVKKALRRKKKLKAKLTLVITDKAGNAQTKKYTVRLKR